MKHFRNALLNAKPENIAMHNQTDKIYNNYLVHKNKLIALLLSPPFILFFYSINHKSNVFCGFLFLISFVFDRLPI